MLSYQEESLRAVRPEVERLMHVHWDEVTGEGPAPDPDWDTFAALEVIGTLHTLTVRDRGVLVGYAVFIITPGLHYRTIKGAHDDAFFLKREYRRGFVGIRLIREAEAMCARHGAQRIFWHCKPRVPQVQALLTRLGYRVRETIMTREI